MNDTKPTLDQEFDDLMEQIQRLLKLAAQGLDPATPDSKRAEIRALVMKYLQT